ncbi:MAG TPA: alpha/beta hydrolase [Streptosporangiaceae bacterium]|jgi:pimeloyl-ACP methyl ester carboxylesterase|nr:alpha/beta hydrolase [Streptosporangiaceae bacterium]
MSLTEHPAGEASGSGITHRSVEVGPLAMHIAEAGSGPLVLLLHGFPECWYSWRHQLPALAAAGYHVVAPDQRGYGRTGAPGDGGVDKYTMLHLVGDVIGLIDALGEEQAVVVGHDWGAPVAWNTALLRPDRIRGVVGLSVPYTPRGSTPPLELLRAVFSDRFYICYFQQPGVADAELSRDPRSTFRRMLVAASGDGPLGGIPVVPEGGGFLDLCPEPEQLPGWLTESDIDVFVEEFARSGFTGPLNWYRTLDLSWELSAAWWHAKVTVPALYLAGDRDLAVSFTGGTNGLADIITDLRECRLLPGCGHWTQQERPAEVNEAMIAFLSGLD